MNQDLVIGWLKNQAKIAEDDYEESIILMLIDRFKDELYDDRLPSTYAEIDYGDREDAEAIEGAKWDDKNYQHYIER